MAYIGTQPKDVRSFGKAQFDFTATASQTVFTGADDDGKTLAFTAGQVSLYVNGILMDASDYSVSNGNTVTLASPANAGDIITVVALQTDIPNSDYVPATGGTFSGNVTFSGAGGAGGVKAVNVEGGIRVEEDVFFRNGVSNASQKVGFYDTDATDTYLYESGGINTSWSEAVAGQYNGKVSVFATPPYGQYPSLDILASTNTQLGAGAVQGTITAKNADLAVDNDLYVGGGVYLGGTGSANRLTDYEEGTWTPSYTASTYTPNITYDSGERSASYTKIGNMVYIIGTIRTDALSGGSGVVYISGLPFTAASISTGERPGGMHVSYQSSFGTVHPTSGYIDNGSVLIKLVSNPHNGNVSALGVGDMSTGTNGNFMMFFGQYRTDA